MVTNFVISESETQMDELALANVEALAVGESSSCHDVNGYRLWDTNGSMGFYDCCSVARRGSCPSGNCM